MTLKNHSPSKIPDSRRFFQRAHGHYMTLAPFISRSLRPPARPETEAFQVMSHDPELGEMRITGRLLWKGSSDLVIVQHGLGGSVDSGYMGLIFRAADAAGRSCLALNSRGADRSGVDIYHSGLTDDLAAAIAHPRFQRIEAIDLFGYSIGGHVALRYCLSDVDPRVRRVAAIGSPLHLGAAADDFDAQSFGVYRTHVMDSLKEIYTKAYQRNPRGILPTEAREIGGIRLWDTKIIAPRFGFSSAEDYYTTQSVAGRLHELKVDALYVGAENDPMVLASSVKPYLDAKRVHAVWDTRSGHLGFQPGFDLGRPAPLGLESQVLSWLSR